MVEIINKLFKYALLNAIDIRLSTFDINGDKFISIQFEKNLHTINHVFTYTTWTEFTTEQRIWIIQNMLNELEGIKRMVIKWNKKTVLHIVTYP